MNKSFDHRGILLVNLGSPDSTAVRDVRRYLNEFLMDGRVLDVPYPLRRLIVSGFILPFRPRKSAEAYRAIWWDSGSPLIVISERVKARLQEQLGMPVALGMRYGNPSIRKALQELISRKVSEILLIPLYPHYAMSTFESVFVKTMVELKKMKSDATLRIVSPFYDDPAYINALLASAADYLAADFDYILFSYHGVPERHLRKTDPTGSHCLASPQCCSTPSPAHETCYRHQVFETTAKFAEAAKIPSDKYSVAFQSRLGRNPWLTPYTDFELRRLAGSGVKKLLVICPSFISDCLETLEEIGIRGKESFLEAGGEDFQLIPCLNDHPSWIEALRGYCHSEGRAEPFQSGSL